MGAFLICFFFLSFVTELPLRAEATKPHRGEIPKCQTTCLAEHTKKIDKLVDSHERERDKMSFQDGVEDALSEYKACIENCRALLPVK